jgi:uncharacterized damage-inducible protein DinB
VKNLVITKPDPSEYAPYYEKDMDYVQGDDVLRTLSAQTDKSLATLRGISDERSLERYAPNKWSIREVVGHLIDCERIFSYRALRFARNDPQELAGFEQDDYIPYAHFNNRAWSDLLSEFELVRRSTVLMYRGLDKEAWMRRGTANKASLTVRAIAYITAGHELHHMQIIRTKYLGAA